jgi:hypothetical protein
MVVTGQAASWDADSVILPSLQMGSVFELGSVSKVRPSLNWIDRLVRFHRANSLSPWIRWFAVHVVSLANRSPACETQKAP